MIQIIESCFIPAGMSTCVPISIILHFCCVHNLYYYPFFHYFCVSPISSLLLEVFVSVYSTMIIANEYTTTLIIIYYHYHTVIIIFDVIIIII